MDAVTRHRVRKILIVIPPMILPANTGRTAEAPLGPAYLAAVLEKLGYDVAILDAICEGFENRHPYPGGRYSFGLSIDAIIDRIREYSPDVLGISCASSLQYELTQEIAHRSRSFSNPPLVAIGGAHVSALPKEVIATGLFDIAVIGEAEETFPKALREIEDGNLDALEKIPGLCFIRDGEIVRTPGVGMVSDLDRLPFPARHLLPMEKYAALHNSASHDATYRRWPFTQMITSRGCPGNCNFCSVRTVTGAKYRTRMVESIMAEMRELRDRWGIREIQFEDDNLTLDRGRAVRLFNTMIDSRLNFTWSVPNGVALWAMKPELIDLMAESGCYKIILPIESGVQRVLDEVIDKPLKLEKIPAFIERARVNHMATHSLFVVGFPRETREEMAETFRYARRIHTDWTSIFIATPYPGTPLYHEALEMGLLPKDFSFDSLDVRNAAIEHPEISASELKAWVNRVEARIRLRSYTRPLNFRRGVKRVLRDPKRVTGYICNLFMSNLTALKRG